ncbi:hypothetical protein [Crocinitomix catalasitica]|uniref:hypothetical protein n=1 Tax=Crocinitomix catalasitica TaxID=184607 RepID=UPI0004898265|nr:hypothetical protein [Crocinitomix catalasitica]
MKQILIIFIVFIWGKIGFGQENDDTWKYLDSVLTETKLVQEINNDSITALMIFYNVYETGGGEAKGFLVDNNIPGGKIDNDLSIPNCTDSCDIRMETYAYSDSLFIIKYKWKGSENFITDTCYLFHYNGSYMAYSKGIYNNKTLKLTQYQWYLGPASTDQREVILICSRERKKTIFYLN